jgi:imidazolonepropionase-like amidohydrolase
VLRPSSQADFVVLAGDSLDDIAATRDVAAVYQNGRHVA